MGRPVSVQKLLKSGGVVQRSPAARQAARSARIREYFYGARGDLHPAPSRMDAASMLAFRSGARRQLLLPRRRRPGAWSARGARASHVCCIAAAAACMCQHACVPTSARRALAAGHSQAPARGRRALRCRWVRRARRARSRSRRCRSRRSWSSRCWRCRTRACRTSCCPATWPALCGSAAWTSQQARARCCCRRRRRCQAATCLSVASRRLWSDPHVVIGMSEALCRPGRTPTARVRLPAGPARRRLATRTVLTAPARAQEFSCSSLLELATARHLHLRCRKWRPGQQGSPHPRSSRPNAPSRWHEPPVSGLGGRRMPAAPCNRRRCSHAQHGPAGGNGGRRAAGARQGPHHGAPR